MKKIMYLLGAVIFASIASGLAYWLLTQKLIQGSEFVSLVTVILIASLIIALFSDISEVSLSSVVLKMNKVKQEAEVTIARLESSLVATFEPLLLMSKKTSGGFGDARSTRDSRIDGFLKLLKSIDKAGVRQALAQEISDTADFFSRVQLQLVDGWSTKVGLYRDVATLPTPDSVTLSALDADLQKVSEQMGLSTVDVRKSLLDAISGYREMFLLTQATAP